MSRESFGVWVLVIMLAGLTIIDTNGVSRGLWTFRDVAGNYFVLCAGLMFIIGTSKASKS